MEYNKKLPLMPKSTAIWLIDNTALTFKQIAEFCGLHELEVEGMADGDVAEGLKGSSPISSGQLTQAEIERCSRDPHAKLALSHSVADEFIYKKSKKKYTPVARRQDKPYAILWLLKNCPGIKDNQIIKLIGTTQHTLNSIKERTHWDIANLKPRDPVLLGLCSQTDLDKLMLVLNITRHVEVIENENEHEQQ
jgi:hypothetical protein